MSDIENIKTEDDGVIDTVDLEMELGETLGGGVYTHKFAKPFEYNGRTYTELSFEWDKLTGKDSREIENELALRGKIVVSPAYSIEYIVRMAARACTERIGADAFDLMSIRDFNKIRGRARAFLLISEL